MSRAFNAAWRSKSALLDTCLDRSSMRTPLRSSTFLEQRHTDPFLSASARIAARGIRLNAFRHGQAGELELELYNAPAMNVLGRRSLSSFFKLLLDVAFYGTCLVGALLTFTLFVALRAGTGKVSMSLPVRFEIDPSAYRIQGTSSDADVRIEDASGNVRVARPPMAAVVLPIMGILGLAAVVLVVLHRLRRIFRRLVEGRPFLDENARSLRFIGIVVMA